MAIFREVGLTPTEFARLAQVDRLQIDQFEKLGLIQTIRKKVGNVDRKMIMLDAIQDFFTKARNGALAEVGRRGDRNVAKTGGEGEKLVAELAQIGRHGDQNDLSQGTGAVAAGPALPLELFPQTPKFKKQMFYNVKGGTGKSTLTAQYVMNAAMLGYRVLGIDLDGQGHLTVNLDVLDGHELPTIYDVLINDLPIQDAIINVAPGLDLLPANLGLCNIEIPLNQKARREYRLSEAIESIKDQYDLIVADTNPAASILNSSMLVAADLVNVVCATNPLSFHGMSLVMATIEEMEREFKRQLEVRIIPNMYDNREVISQEVLGELRAQFGDWCTKTVVSRTADLNEATKRRTTVWEVNTRGSGAQDIGSLTQELVTL